MVPCPQMVLNYHVKFDHCNNGWRVASPLTSENKRLNLRNHFSKSCLLFQFWPGQTFPTFERVKA